MSTLLDIRKRIVHKKKVHNLSKPMQIRDSRDREWFLMDNILVDEYAREIGVHGLSVYMSLCRHSNKDQNSWPSIDRIADEMGMTARSVIRGLRILEDKSMIKVDRKRGESSIYTLLNRRKWRKNKVKWFGAGGSRPATKDEKVRIKRVEG